MQCPQCAQQGHVGPQYHAMPVGPEDVGERGELAQKHLCLVCGWNQWMPKVRQLHCPHCRRYYQEEQKANEVKVPCPACAQNGETREIGDSHFGAHPDDQGRLAFIRFCTACRQQWLITHEVRHQCALCQRPWSETQPYQAQGALMSQGNLTAEELLRTMPRIS